MLKTCIVLAFLVGTVVTTAPAYAQDKDCSKVNTKDQPECYYEQADNVATQIVETVTEKCEKFQNKVEDQAFCTAFAMLTLLEEAKKWEPKNR